QGQPAHIATQFRDAPAGRRRRPAHGARAAGTRQHPHDPALHARRPQQAASGTWQVSSARVVFAICRMVTQVHLAVPVPSIGMGYRCTVILPLSALPMSVTLSVSSPGVMRVTPATKT